MSTDASDSEVERRVGATQGLIWVNTQRVRQLGDIADAARVYREVMERYKNEQEELMAQGVTIDELVTRNFARFEEVAAAEERLFTTVDAVGARGEPRSGIG